MRPFLRHCLRDSVSRNSSPPKENQNQQLPREEVERFAKESRGPKTTVFAEGAVMLGFLPMVITVLSIDFELTIGLHE